MAAPRKHPPKGAAEAIRQLAASGHSQLGIASKLGVTVSTFKRWLDEDELLQDAFDLGRETERQELHAMVVKSAREGKPANVNAFFILKSRHGYVEADQKSSSKVNIAVEAQNVLMVVDHGTDEEWAAKAAAQQRELAEAARHDAPVVSIGSPSQTQPALLLAETTHTEPIPSLPPGFIPPVWRAR